MDRRGLGGGRTHGAEAANGLRGEGREGTQSFKEIGCDRD